MYCGAVRKEQIGKKLTLCGWIHSRRDHGGVLFIDLRDREGLVQIVFHPEKTDAFKSGESLRPEFVVQVTGEVKPRPEGTVNPNIATGEVEVWVDAVEILNTSLTPPFEVSEFTNTSEDVRLRYRYLDLRRPPLQRNLILRHLITQTSRTYLAQRGFLELETPFLTKSTPEGARDFLVPSRLSLGDFYALPQSPQLFKQLFMVAGFDRYYQIARCFRDEDLRADRQPEFTQIDIEMSFLDEEDIIGLIEGLVKTVFKEAMGKDIPTPFPRLSYDEAQRRFGSDKPDLRYAMEISDVSAVFSKTGFKVFAGALAAGGVVRALCLKGGASMSRMDIDKLTEWVKGYGAKGLAWIKITDKGPESSITKFFTPEELGGLQKAVGAETGDIIFFGADQPATVASYLGALRVELAKRAGFTKTKDVFKFCWVVDFPLFEFSADENRWGSVHHPFTRPDAAGETALLEMSKKNDFSAPEISKMKSRAYDLVLNGTELGGGSLRIHRRDLQRAVFQLLGINDELAQMKFGFLLEALEYGAPPHGGIALGLDRFVALLAGEESIRDVMAYPKTQKGVCPLSGAPSAVEPKQLLELGLKLNLPQPDGKKA